MPESTLGLRREPPFTLQLMGGMRLSTTARPRLRITSRKACALLAYLAHPPGVRHERHALATLLWEDTDPRHARWSLRRALSDLRRHLGNALCGEGDRVWLEPSAFSVDTAAFLRATSDRSIEEIGLAAPLYGGDLLAGLTIASRAFTRWQLLTRQTLHSRMLVCRACCISQQPSMPYEDVTHAY